MTDKAIETITFENAGDRIRDKIKLAFIEAMPDEQWNKMIADELKKFFETRNYNTRNYGAAEYGSPFGKLCERVFEEEIRAMVKKSLSDHKFTGLWDGNETLVGEYVGQWLTDNAESLLKVVLERTIGAVAQETVQRMRGL